MELPSGRSETAGDQETVTHSQKGRGRFAWYAIEDLHKPTWCVHSDCDEVARLSYKGFHTERGAAGAHEWLETIDNRQPGPRSRYRYRRGRVSSELGASTKSKCEWKSKERYEDVAGTG